jgi:dihydrofolate synthase/folylpolyglutamate synthase
VTFAEAEEFIYSFVDWEKSGGRPTDPDDLVRFREFLRTLGDPHSDFPVVHVVGTNGKGSVCAMLASILTAGGERVGLYTSPHLVTVRERIQVNGVPISEVDFAACVERLQTLADEVRLIPGGYRTTFELLTALALLHFQKREVSIAVVEAGLGGRLDATVVLDPQLSVVTPIHLDHTGALGRTLRVVAADKCAVIRSGIPLVTAPQPAAARRVLASVVEERNPTRWLRIGHEARYLSWCAGDGYRGARFSIGKRQIELERLPLRGRHQVANAAVAVTGALTLQPELSSETVKAGILGTCWPGRLETINGAPLLLLEGAHNPHAARSLAAFLDEWVESERRPATLLVAISKGKDVDGILAPLLPIASSLISCCPVPVRNMAAEEVRERATELGFDAGAEPSPHKALRLAESRAGDDGLVVVCGSLYLVGHVAEIRGAHRSWWARGAGSA